MLEKSNQFQLSNYYDWTTVVGPVAVVVTTVMTVFVRPSGKSRATSFSRTTVA